MVMSGSICHELDQLFVRPINGLGTEFIHQGTDRAYHINVSLLTVATDVLGFTVTSPLKNCNQCSGVIIDIQPVSHILTIAEHGQ